ncbi:MAG: hypothetical protein WC829_03080 [Hyphomicrobium sp.]|jgi:hypothetical protein
MGALAKLLDPYRWLLGGVLIAGVIAAFFAYRASLVQEGVEREQAKVAQAVAEQKALAEAQTRNMQEIADEAQQTYINDMAAAQAAADRAAADLARLRGKAASAVQLANASQASTAEYAADAERSVDFCAAELVRTGETAESASSAAHALYAAWPEYQEFQSKLTTFTNTPKGSK